MATRAAEFMEKNRDANKPFFIQMSWHALHAPQNAMKTTLAKYAQRMGSSAEDKKLFFADGTYDGVVSSGTFLQGHVGPEALPELCRVLRPGGFMVFSVRPNYFQETRSVWMDTLAAEGMVDVTVSMRPYDKFGLMAPVVCCYKASSLRARL